MTKKARPWDAAEFIRDEQDAAAYLAAVLEDGSPELLKAALLDVARAQGVTRLARDAGMSRHGLYKALSEDGNPAFSTMLAIISALGLSLKIQRTPANVTEQADDSYDQQLQAA